MPTFEKIERFEITKSLHYESGVIILEMVISRRLTNQASKRFSCPICKFKFPSQKQRTLFSILMKCILEKSLLS